MHLMAVEEYGLRCLLQVASHGGDDPLSISAIAAAEGLTPEYTAKLMRQLRLGRLVTSARGAGGGYRLARPADEISVWATLEVLGGEPFPEGFCRCFPGRGPRCTRASDCPIRALWRATGARLRRQLDSITLADLCRDEGSMASWLGDGGAAGVRANPN